MIGRRKGSHLRCLVSLTRSRESAARFGMPAKDLSKIEKSAHFSHWPADMDPVATWRNLVFAVAQCDEESAKESAHVLQEWLSRGGFPPCVIPEFESISELQRAVCLQICSYFLENEDNV